ncbi:MAG TPA: hypothetical protein VLA66_07175 [Thermoanaerobaculia bacterium]|nr:hypothetical protein [Thermoanaerobaculia bacterium]
MDPPRTGFGPRPPHPRVRRVHRVLALALALPLFTWAATGLLFFLKPGWAAAYAQLELPARELPGPRTISPGVEALEARWLVTPLGEHLLVRTAAGWRHLDAATGAEWPEPDAAALRPLVEAAIASHPERDGSLLGRDERGRWRTSTGVRIDLDWRHLRFTQRGYDTDAIDLAYRIHYLQWTGYPPVDRWLGGLGLAGLAALAGFGLRLARRPRFSDGTASRV